MVLGLGTPASWRRVEIHYRKRESGPGTWRHPGCRASIPSKGKQRFGALFSVERSIELTTAVLARRYMIYSTPPDHRRTTRSRQRSNIGSNMPSLNSPWTLTTLLNGSHLWHGIMAVLAQSSRGSSRSFATHLTVLSKPNPSSTSCALAFFGGSQQLQQRISRTSAPEWLKVTERAASEGPHRSLAISSSVACSVTSSYGGISSSR